MSTVSVPGQNFSYWIPDDGQIYTTSSGDIWYRSGNQLSSISKDSLTALGYNANSYLQSIGVQAPVISDSQHGDAIAYTSRGQTGLTLGTGDINSLQGLAPKAAETITAAPSPTNSNALTLMSSVQGDITDPNTPKYGQPGAMEYNATTAVNPNATALPSGGLGGYTAPVDPLALRPGETTTQYNARMATMNSSGGTSYSTGPIVGGSTAGSTAISSNSLGGAPTVNYSQAPALPQISAAKGLDTSVPQITMTPQESDLQTRMNALMSLNTQESTKGQYTSEQNAAQDVAGKTRLVNDFSSQLKVIQLEAANIQQTVQQGQGVTTAVDQRQRAEALRLNNVKSLGVYAQLEMAKGNLATAQDAVDRAVELKYGPIEAQIKAAQENIDLLRNSPGFTVADKNRALTVEASLDARSAAIAQQKQNEQRVWDVYVKAVENGLTDVTKLNAIKNAATPQEALAIAAQAGVAVPAGKTVVSGALSYSQNDINEGYNILKTGKDSSGQSFGNPMGADGFVDPRVYLTMLDQWRQSGGQVDDFLKQYPLTLINPSNTWIGAELQNRAVEWKPQGTATGAFTDVELRKLEQAGLTNATRQQQLDHLYGSTADAYDSF